MPENQAISMRLTKQTVDLTEQLKTWTNSRTRTDVVVFALSLAWVLVKAVREHKKIVLEDEAGNREALVVPELAAMGL